MKRLLLIFFLMTVSLYIVNAENKYSIASRTVEHTVSCSFYSNTYFAGSVDRLVLYSDGTCAMEWSGRDGSYSMKMSGTFRVGGKIRYFSVKGTARFPGETPFKAEMTGTYNPEVTKGIFICIFDSTIHPCHNGHIYDGDKSLTAFMDTLYAGKKLPEWFWDKENSSTEEGAP
jgi:hypothetical protein